MSNNGVLPELAHFDPCYFFLLSYDKHYPYHLGRFYHTLWLGKGVHSCSSDYFWRDDNCLKPFNGENWLYSEYSGILMAAQRLQKAPDSTIISCCHYDWMFSKKTIIGRQKIRFGDAKKWLSRYDIVLAQEQDVRALAGNPQSCREGDESVCGAGNVAWLEKAIAALYPEALSAFRDFYSGHTASFCSLLLTRKPIFEEYVSFYQNVTDWVKPHLNFDGIKDKRILGFFGEFLLNVFVIYKRYRVGHCTASSCYPFAVQVCSKLRKR